MSSSIAWTLSLAELRSLISADTEHHIKLAEISHPILRSGEIPARGSRKANRFPVVPPEAADQ